MAFNRSHARHMRLGRFNRIRHSRRVIDWLDTQSTRLTATATGKTVLVQTGVATFTGDGTALANTDTVTIGSKTYTVKTALTFAAATGTLTNDGSQPADTSTVVINGKTYTFQSSLTNVDGNVKIGASNTATMTNLFHAINASGGTVGTDYATATVAHTTVTATNPSGTTVVVTAITKGAAGNAYATTVGGTSHSAWGGATLASGADDVANEVLRSTAAATLTNLFHTINATGGTAGTDYSLATVAHTLGVATNPSGTTVVFTITDPGTTALATTTTASHGSWGATTVAGSGVQFTVTAHALVDYDGPFVLTTSGTLPTGLALATEYWIKKVDTDTIKFAKSVANLKNGTYVIITTNGSGTHTLKRARDRQGMFETLRSNGAAAVMAATDIDNLR